LGALNSLLVLRTSYYSINSVFSRDALRAKAQLTHSAYNLTSLRSKRPIQICMQSSLSQIKLSELHSTSHKCTYGVQHTCSPKGIKQHPIGKTASIKPSSCLMPPVL